MSVIVDNTWYIAITQIFSGKYYSFTAAGGQSFHDFKELALRRGEMNIMAENFDVTDENIDRVGERVAGLIKVLNKGREVDIQKALNHACAV